MRERGRAMESAHAVSAHAGRALAQLLDQARQVNSPRPCSPRAVESVLSRQTKAGPHQKQTGIHAGNLSKSPKRAIVPVNVTILRRKGNTTEDGIEKHPETIAGAGEVVLNQQGFTMDQQARPVAQSLEVFRGRAPLAGSLFSGGDAQWLATPISTMPRSANCFAGGMVLILHLSILRGVSR